MRTLFVAILSVGLIGIIPAFAESQTQSTDGGEEVWR